MANVVQETGRKSRSEPSFLNTRELSLPETRTQVKLPVIREDLISVENKVPSSYQMVLLESNKELKLLGEVKANRPFIRHEELMDWLLEEFDKLGMEFKLHTHQLSQGKFSLFQQYLFNYDIDTPDRQKVSPLVYVKNSFVGGSVFELHFGTFRYVCTNGAIHTEKELSHITANSGNWKSIRQNGLVGAFENAFASYENVSDFFRYLYSMPLSDKFEKLFSPGLLPIGLRKKILASLELSKDIDVNIDIPRKKAKTKSRYLKEEDLVNIKDTVSLTGNLSVWDVYNRFTSYTSNQLESGSGVLNANRHIDYAFSAVAERKGGIKKGKKKQVTEAFPKL